MEHPSLPGNFILNAKKILLHPSTGTDCPWIVMWSLIDSSTVVQSVKFDPDSIQSEKETLDYLLSKTKPLKLKNTDEDYDYYFVCVWAIFTPKLTRDSFKELYRFKNNQNKKICVILINADIQKEWN